MLTQSTERFVKIQKEAPKDCQEYLVQVTKYQAAQHCKVTIFIYTYISISSALIPIFPSSPDLDCWQMDYS